MCGLTFVKIRFYVVFCVVMLCVCVCIRYDARRVLRYRMSSSNEIAFSRPSQCLLKISHNGPLLIIK